MKNIIEQIEKEEIGEIKLNIPFKALTTYKTGGKARCVVFPYSVENLIKLIKILKKDNIPFKIFGNGSNILVSDNDYEGVIIKLSEIDNIEIDNEIVRVGAGYNLMKLANDMSKNGYSGLEWACGIPGTIGGAVYMNAGAYLKSISDILLSVDILDEKLNFKTLTKDKINFDYRYSSFMDNNWICLGVILKFKKQNVDEIVTLINDRKIRRLSSQPLEYPSAGSVFRNPEGDFAGRLIEESHLKGMMIGGAQISDKHANFIINKDNATSNDIKELIDLAKKTVKEKYNIELKIEQELFNWE